MSSLSSSVYIKTEHFDLGDFKLESESNDFCTCCSIDLINISNLIICMKLENTETVNYFLSTVKTQPTVCSIELYDMNVRKT